MNTKQLRQKILDLAIRGKLVPQDPNDESACVLLERIREEKEQFAKKGNVKKEKLLPKMEKDEILYSLPKGWAWCQLSQIATFFGGKTPSTSNVDFWNGSINWTTSKDMKAKYIDSTIIKMSELGAKQMQIFPPRTLVMVVRSGILRRTLPISILRQESTVNQDIKAISFCIDDICEFIYYFFLANEAEILIKYSKSGTTVESINFDELKNIYIPLPPLDEQRRIVAAVDSAFAIIDEIDRNKTDLQAAVTAAKQKILSLAIQGKLVPQDQNNEPIVAIYGESKIETEQIPYDLPTGWSWYQLDEIGTTNIGLTYKPTDICDDGIPVMRSSNIKDGRLDFSDLVRVKTSITNALELNNGDILICARNGSRHLVGKCAIVQDIQERLTFGAFMAVYRSACNPYIYHFLNSKYFRSIFESEGISTQINQLTQSMLKRATIPLPPLTEQRRIVSMIDN